MLSDFNKLKKVNFTSFTNEHCIDGKFSKDEA